MCESADELPEGVRIPKRDLGLDISLCHAITIARTYGWAMAVDKDQTCFGAGLSLGFLPLLPDVADGSFQASIGLGGMTKEQAATSIKDIPKFEYGKYKYALIVPLDKITFEPHIFLFYGNPAQVWTLLEGYLSGHGQSSITVTMKTGGGCATYVTQAMQLDEAQFSVVDKGERLYPHAQDSECVLSVPVSKIEKTIQGLENCYETGYEVGSTRYPVPSFLLYNSKSPPGYDKMTSHLRGES
jgi:uncharacterized protein (DUF169 family)